MLKFPPIPRVIRVPRMCYLGVCPPKLSYEGEETYAIVNNVKGFPMGHALLSVQEAT